MKYIPALLVAIGLGVSFPSFGQVFLKGGYGYTGMQHDGAISGYSGRINPQFGIGFGGVLASKHNLYFQVEGLYARRGYKQDFLGEEYLVHFNYVTLPMMVVWDPRTFMAVELGVELANLSSVRMKSATANRTAEEGYTGGDVGLLLGVQFLSTRTLSLNLRYTHGLRAQVNYWEFDEWGNFVRPVKTLFNRSLTASVHINISRR
jgi:hypothetical protein